MFAYPLPLAVAPSAPSSLPSDAPLVDLSGTRLFVGNVPEGIDASILKEILGQFCDPADADSKVLHCQIECQRGIGQVVFSDQLSPLIAVNSGLKIGDNLLQIAYEMKCLASDAPQAVTETRTSQASVAAAAPKRQRVRRSLRTSKAAAPASTVFESRFIDNSPKDKRTQVWVKRELPSPRYELKQKWKKRQNTNSHGMKSRGTKRSTIAPGGMAVVREEQELVNNDEEKYLTLEEMEDMGVMTHTPGNGSGNGARDTVPYAPLAPMKPPRTPPVAPAQTNRKTKVRMTRVAGNAGKSSRAVQRPAPQAEPLAAQCRSVMRYNRCNSDKFSILSSSDEYMTIRIKTGDFAKRRLSGRQYRRRNLEHLDRMVVSQRESFGLVTNYVVHGHKQNRRVLVLAEIDFSLSKSIIKCLGNGHQVIATSQFSEYGNGLRRHSMICHRRSIRNVRQIEEFGTSLNFSKRSVVLRPVDPLHLKRDLNQKLGQNIGSGIRFDTIVYPFPVGTAENHYDLRNFVKMKQIFENINSVVDGNRGSWSVNGKPEIHFLMPIFATRAQFESVKVFEIGAASDLSIKWKLKYGQPIILDREHALREAFGNFKLRHGNGTAIWNDEFQYVGYYIMQAMDTEWHRDDKESTMKQRGQCSLI